MNKKPSPNKMFELRYDNVGIKVNLKKDCSETILDDVHNS